MEADKIFDRAWELARYIMTETRSCRRLTHHVYVRPWKALVERDLRDHVLSEMYSFNLSNSAHDFDSIFIFLATLHCLLGLIRGHLRRHTH